MIGGIVRQLAGSALVLSGLYLVTFGSSWASIVIEILERSYVGEWLLLIAPFLPMLLIACGAVIYTQGRSH